MLERQKLIAAVTASGAMLLLSVSADGHANSQQGVEPNPFPELLSLRVEQLRAKLQQTTPGDTEATPGKLDNIVQFFNFYNCMRPGWRNC
jgi:hypothetical protein